MPIPPPRLDDRDYHELLTEMRSRISAFTPEWTDLSPTDPGVTLMEALALHGEGVLYRFNQIPDAMRSQLLRLLDVPLRPAASARGLVAFEARPPRTDVADPGRSHTLSTPAVVRAGDVPFETLDDVALLPLVAIPAIRQASDQGPGSSFEDSDLRAAVDAALDAVGAPDDATAQYYTTSQLASGPVDASAPPLAVPEAVDRALWIALTVEAPDALAGTLAAGGPLEPDSGDAAVLNLGVAVTTEPVAMVDVSPSLVPGSVPGPASQIDWTVSTSHVRADEDPEFLPLTVEADSTNGLQQDGVVRLRLPRPIGQVGVPLPPAGGAGAGAFPPVLADEPVVAMWIRARPVSGGPDIPSLRWVGTNAARVVQATTASAEFLGTGTGNPGQVFLLGHRPVQPDLLPIAVEVQEDGESWTPWQCVPSMGSSRRLDRHFVLDAEAGTIAFGDTVRGMAPQPGQAIKVRPYRFGGGPEGVLAAGAVNADQSGLAARVYNSVPTAGGAAAESLLEALDRIPGEFRRHDRAVTASDFAELALATPGAEVVRAECLPRFRPPNKETDAAGVVTVVVWPRRDIEHPQAPRPERGLLSRVCMYLDQRRLVTTELYVVPPEYRTVEVSLAVAVRNGYSPDGVRRWCDQVLRQYLSPVPPFGPQGGGWPLGRRVYGPELEAAVLQVEGVEYVAELRVAEPTIAGAGPIQIDPWQVVELGTVQVVVGPSASPFSWEAGAGGSTTGGGSPVPTPVPVPVPVPVRRHRC